VGAVVAGPALDLAGGNGPKVIAAEVIAVTGRSRRRAYEQLRDARTEQG
jgi:hypothetical protein